MIHLCEVKFSLAGSGNVAHHFAEMLINGGHQLVQVWSKNIDHAKKLAGLHSAAVAQHPSQFSDINELIIVAVKDDAIREIAAEIPLNLAVVHTSGACAADILPQSSSGVIWPLYSLTKGITAEYSKMPIIIESGDPAFRKMLEHEFSRISENVRLVEGSDRARVHLAAVFANNFSNQMYDIAGSLMEKSGLALDLLLPIIEQAAEKIRHVSPETAQTGPARRADMATIAEHLRLLNDDPEAERIYKSVTDRILKKYHDKKL